MLGTTKDLPVVFATDEQEAAFNLKLRPKDNAGPLGCIATRGLPNEPARLHWLSTEFDETVEKSAPVGWTDSSCLSSCGDATEQLEFNWAGGSSVNIRKSSSVRSLTFILKG